MICFSGDLKTKSKMSVLGVLGALGQLNLLSTVYCLLSTVYCLLSTVYCLLSTVYCLLSTVYCLLSTVYCLLSTVYCLLFTVYCLHTLFCLLGPNCRKQWHNRLSRQFLTVQTVSDRHDSCSLYWQFQTVKTTAASFRLSRKVQTYSY